VLNLVQSRRWCHNFHRLPVPFLPPPRPFAFRPIFSPGSGLMQAPYPRPGGRFLSPQHLQTGATSIFDLQPPFPSNFSPLAPPISSFRPRRQTPFARPNPPKTLAVGVNKKQGGLTSKDALDAELELFANQRKRQTGPAQFQPAATLPSTSAILSTNFPVSSSMKPYTMYNRAPSNSLDACRIRRLLERLCEKKG